MAVDSARSGVNTPRDIPSPTKNPRQQHMDDITQRLLWQLNAQLPNVLAQLMASGHDPDNQPLQLECSLTPAGSGSNSSNRVPVATVDLSSAGVVPNIPFSPPAPPPPQGLVQHSFVPPPVSETPPPQPSWTLAANATIASPQLQFAEAEDASRPSKRTRRQHGAPSRPKVLSPTSTSREDSDAGRVRKKRSSGNPALQPSTFNKFVHGIWDSLYSGIRVDPAEVIQQWQAIEASSHPQSLTDAQGKVPARGGMSKFARMNILTRKISQTSKTCRSLEIIVQAHWVQCFDDHVTELATITTREKAKKSAIADACVDFDWSEKELRNKMGIWRGYHDIKNAAGWVALVFAGTGLYRFCKYRVSFSDETFATLRSLRHRFEVAADTLHPNWRLLLGIVGASTEPRYTGHPLDWVVNGPDGEAIPLFPTYHQWDPNFTYKHIQHSEVDEEAWGDYDPRTVRAQANNLGPICEDCHERQSDDAMSNSCRCYSNLYGASRPGPVPYQLFRTPDGKNNGLIACCAIEKGWAVGEFVGLITSGIAGLDVMVGQTDHATYQIWQGKEGNHTRFVNHSCKPNSQFERFVWLGKQRIVLASLGIEAGQEVTVDYGDTYWHNLDKVCRCGQPCCRYKDRNRLLEGVTADTTADDDRSDGDVDADMDDDDEEDEDD